MGVPKFFLWIKNKEYRGVLIKYLPRNVSSFSLDLNSILHTIAQQVYSYGSGFDEQRSKLVAQTDPLLLEAEYHQVLASKLTELIRQVNPQDVLVLAVDGVAPQAKIAQQRQRRYRASFEAKDIPTFDSTCISPGTEFMMRLDIFLQKYLISMANVLPPKVIYSSHNKPSEGEHEIFSLIKKGEIPTEHVREYEGGSEGNVGSEAERVGTTEPKNNAAHVIYGMDADLIMLSLISDTANIFLMREDIFNIVNIDNLRSSLKAEMKTETAISDFVLMMFLIGNDFLPHIVSLADLNLSIKTMLSVYEKLKISLTSDRDILWDNLSLYLTSLADLEPELLKEESKKETKYISNMMEAATTRTSKVESNGVVVRTSLFNPDVFRSAWYSNALNVKEPDIFETLMPTTDFNKVSSEQLTNMLSEYLTGLAWTFRYYKLGMESVNNNYIYRYHYSPLLKDLAYLIKKYRPDPDHYINNSDSLIINPVHQLLAIIPYKSRNLLPKEVLQLTSNSSIADIFIENAIVKRDGMNSDWQGVILIDFVDMSRIISAVNDSCTFTEKRLLQFSPVHNIVLTKNKEIEKIRLSGNQFREFLQKSADSGNNRLDNRNNRSNSGRGYDNRSDRIDNRNNNGRGYDNRTDRSDNTNTGRGYDNRTDRNVDNRNNTGRGYDNRSDRTDNRNTGRGYDNRSDRTDNRNSGRGRGYNRTDSGTEDNGRGRGYNNRTDNMNDRNNTGRGRGYNNKNVNNTGRGRGRGYNTNKSESNNVNRDMNTIPTIKPKIILPTGHVTQLFEL